MRKEVVVVPQSNTGPAFGPVLGNKRDTNQLEIPALSKEDLSAELKCLCCRAWVASAEVMLVAACLTLLCDYCSLSSK